MKDRLEKLSDNCDLPPPITIGLENIETDYFNDKMFEFTYKNNGNHKIEHFKSIDKVNNVTQTAYNIRTAQNGGKSCYLDYIKKISLKHELYLTIGMPILFMSNKINSFISNNQMGIVSDIQEDLIKVEPINFDEGNNSNFKKYVEVKRESQTEEINKYIINREQFPIKPAFASTVHIIQGCTVCYPQTVVFNNQRMQYDNEAVAYAALGRVEDYKNIFILFPITHRDIVVNKKAKDFDSYHRSLALNNSIIDVNYIINKFGCIDDQNNDEIIIENDDNVNVYTTQSYAATLGYKEIISRR
jgi:hypothetical protein